jgi:two-component system, OmpR family, KDP operon response regulator KdpE
VSERIRLLVVDDEAPIRRFLHASLPEKEYEVLEAQTGKEGVTAVATVNPDLVLLDLGLPDVDGIEVLKHLREWSKTPVIVLSARGQEGDKILALDNGADDYITKPSGVGELLARIRVVLRRVKSDCAAEPSFTSGPLQIDFEKRQVFVSGAEVHLTPIEYRLLVLLARNRGKVLTHKYLLETIWGNAYSRQSHYLRVFMGQLRHKIESDPARPIFLTTEPGVGYRFRTADD